jgi:hypothetical protein
VHVLRAIADPDVIDVYKVSEEVKEVVISLKKHLTSEDQTSMQRADIKSLVCEELLKAAVGYDASNVPMVTAPTKFSAESTMSKVQLLKLATTTNSVRFSGKNDPKNPITIVHTLTELAELQESLEFSEKEFRQQMKNSFSAGAQTEVIEMMQRKMSIKDMYSALESKYYFDIPPQAAKEALEAFAPDKHSFLHWKSAELEVTRLAKLASLAYRNPQTRNYEENRLIVIALQALIPKEYRNTIMAEAQRISGLSQDDISVDMLKSLIKVHETMINQNWGRKAKRDKEVGTKLVHQASSSASPCEQSTPGKGDFQGEAPSESFKKDKRRSPKENKPSQINQVASGNPHVGPAADSRPQVGKTDPIPPTKGTPCLLCTMTSHCAEDCYLFTPSQRIPSKEVCSTCHGGKHMEKFCPMTKLAPKN